MFVRRGAEFEKPLFERLKRVGRAWLHTSDAEAWKRYISPPTYQTPQGALIAEAIASEKLSPKKKQEVVSKAAQTVLKELAQAKNAEEQKQKREEARKVIEDALAIAGDQVKSLLQEIWQAAQLDPDMDHAINVSSYSVIFAMAFGRINEELLSDLALSGLLHDIGLSQIPAHLAAKPWNTLSPEESLRYAEHVESGAKLLDEFAPSASTRVREVLLQHHEKFNGSGYPRKLEGFAFDDVAQLVAMAELGDSMGSGQWDGQNRLIKEVFDFLETLEKRKAFPEYFNPEVFNQVVRWIRSAGAEDALGTASQLVGKQVTQVIDSSAA
jgi:HD-GYP domain-containing protein (c-di-GMP phosphodiesterase class II)